jgi:hypothetical protein
MIHLMIHTGVTEYQMPEMSEKGAFPYMSIRHFVEICNPLRQRLALPHGDFWLEAETAAGAKGCQS